MPQPDICKNTITCNCKICNPPLISDYNHVPAPRLVCIETNPGPLLYLSPSTGKKALSAAKTGQLVSIAEEGAFQLGKMAAGKKTKQQPKQKQKRRTRSGTTGASRSSVTPLNAQVSAPVTYGRVMQTSTPNANIRVPFSTSSIFVFASSVTNGNLTFGLSDGSKRGKLLLCPRSQILDTTGSSPVVYDYAFGNAIRDLASLYKEYQVTKLNATFIPLRATNTPGLVTISATPDPTVGTPASLDRASAYAQNMTTSVWQTATMGLGAICGKNATETKYYMPSRPGNATVSDSNGRITTLGAIVGFLSGYSGAANDPIGILRLDGEIEFRELSPFEDLQSGESKDNYPDNTPQLIKQSAYISENNSQTAQTSSSSSSLSHYDPTIRLSQYPSPNLSGNVTPYGGIPIKT